MAWSPPNSPGNNVSGHLWHFGDCEFDAMRYELRIHGRSVDLEVKPLQVLHQLLLRAGEVVPKEDLLEKVWPGVLVVDASLATAVSKLRKALEDQGDIIKTVPKIGYRVAVPVRCTSSPGEGSAQSEDITPAGVVGAQNRYAFWKTMGWGAAALVLLAVSLGLVSFRNSALPRQAPGAVAILPFENASSDQNFDYLKSALPDQVATTLSMARSLTIRPLAESNRFAGTSDMRKAGRELNVDVLVAGHYVVVGDELQVTFEAIDPARNSILWRDTLNVPSNNLLQLQTHVAALSRGKLADALGIRDFVGETVRPPSNAEAYELYLKSVALDWDPEPNQKGIELLRRAVLLDPNYAPAWGMLCLRYYTLSRFAGGGPEAMKLADAAAQKQLALDPESTDPLAELTIHVTERGELVKAHQQAIEILKRRPDVANNHHVLSYVLRYGGSLEEAGRECETAVLLATKVVWGSCSTTFMELGNYQRARDFLRKDLSSEWSKAHAVEVYLRQGKTQQAIEIGPPKIPHWDSYKMLLACASGQPESEIKRLATGVEIDDDPEVNYFFAAHLAYCGQKEPALRLLKLAIDRNYCSYPTMDLDPFFDKLRNDAAFVKVRAAGIECHNNFVADREPARSVTLSEAAAVSPKIIAAH